MNEQPKPALLQPERRSTEDRRKASSRREEIRFQPGRDSDRREGKDRRRLGGWDNTRW